MTAAIDGLSISGTATVVRFNWPKYVAVAGLAVASTVATICGLPPLVTIPMWLASGLAVTWSVTSLVATWWVYDRGAVYAQVPIDLGSVGAWASLHAGFDESTDVLAGAFGHGPDCVIELSPTGRASLRRARGNGTPSGSPGEVGSIPVSTASLDAVFVTFAAHEVRDLDEQRALFAELRRVLRPAGRLVVTEHLRDVANAAVYGPAALHFQSGRTWLRRSSEVGLELIDERKITPFVRRLVWRR